jgi:arginine exporter protein ArgO
MLTAALLASVFGLALLDRLNPSALLATLYFLGKPSYTKKILTYVSGIFITSLAFGVVVLLGLDAVLSSFEDVLYSPTAYALQGVIGAIMLGYDLLAPTKDNSGRKFSHHFSEGRGEYGGK